MTIIRNMLARATTSRLWDRLLPEPTCIAVLAATGDIPFRAPIQGTLVRTGLLWKNATLHLSTPEGLVTVEGMPAAISELRRRYPGAAIRIALPIHDGYLALYGPDGHVAARILQGDGVLKVRFMDPHASYEAHDASQHVAEEAFSRLERERGEAGGFR